MERHFPIPPNKPNSLMSDLGFYKSMPGAFHAFQRSPLAGHFAKSAPVDGAKKRKQGEGDVSPCGFSPPPPCVFPVSCRREVWGGGGSAASTVLSRASRKAG